MKTTYPADPRPVNRAEPLLAAAQYKTYAIASPIETHYRDATCREVDCGNYKHGWKTVLDVSKADHARTANWIRLQSGRHYTFTQVGTIVTFVFQKEQRCFTPHKVKLEREEFFLVTGGDWRGNPLNIPVRQHKPDNWVDDFANHQDKIATRIQRG